MSGVIVRAVGVTAVRARGTSVQTLLGEGSGLALTEAEGVSSSVMAAAGAGIVQSSGEQSET